MHIAYLVSFSNYLTWLYLNACPLFTSSSNINAISVQFLNCDSTVKYYRNARVKCIFYIRTSVYSAMITFEMLIRSYSHTSLTIIYISVTKIFFFKNIDILRVSPN